MKLIVYSCRLYSADKGIQIRKCSYKLLIMQLLRIIKFTQEIKKWLNIILGQLAPPPLTPELIRIRIRKQLDSDQPKSGCRPVLPITKSIKKLQNVPTKPKKGASIIRHKQLMFNINRSSARSVKRVQPSMQFLFYACVPHNAMQCSGTID